MIMNIEVYFGSDKYIVRYKKVYVAAKVRLIYNAVFSSTLQIDLKATISVIKCREI